MLTALTCTLTAPGLGSSSSGFILERLWCIGSPVLVTADSLVGLICGKTQNHSHLLQILLAYFFFQLHLILCRIIKIAIVAYKWCR